MKDSVRRALFRVLRNRWVGRHLRTFSAGEGCIFVLHRFDTFPNQRAGHHAAQLASVLEHLRRIDVALVSVDEAVRRALKDGQTTNRLGRRAPIFVAFSIDDCYIDFGEIAAPVFRSFDCPVTGFVCPGLIDTGDWFWWDKLLYVLEQDASRETPGRRSLVSSHSVASFAGTFAQFDLLCEELKQCTSQERLARIGQLAEGAGVNLPLTPPPQYRLADWKMLRSLECDLVQFGAHTQTHPILSQCDELESEYEIRESISRVRQELLRPSNVFCYPNGLSGDFGEREAGTLRAAGVSAALTCVPGSIRCQGSSVHPYRIPRFSYENDLGILLKNLLLGR